MTHIYVYEYNFSVMQPVNWREYFNSQWMWKHVPGFHWIQESLPIQHSQNYWLLRAVGSMSGWLRNLRFVKVRYAQCTSERPKSVCSLSRLWIYLHCRWRFGFISSAKFFLSSRATTFKITAILFLVFHSRTTQILNLLKYCDFQFFYLCSKLSITQ